MLQNYVRNFILVTFEMYDHYHYTVMYIISIGFQWRFIYEMAYFKHMYSL